MVLQPPKIYQKRGDCSWKEVSLPPFGVYILSTLCRRPSAPSDTVHHTTNLPPRTFGPTRLGVKRVDVSLLLMICTECPNGTFSRFSQGSTLLARQISQFFENRPSNDIRPGTIFLLHYRHSFVLRAESTSDVRVRVLCTINIIVHSFPVVWGG